jgi:hypothetical protein
MTRPQTWRDAPTRRLALAGWLVAALACHETLDAGGAGVDAGMDDDPLTVPAIAENGALDNLYDTILVKRCSGQPGLCHNGQFEPNLSTPALAYAYLVNRPSLEIDRRLRVAPGRPEDSVLVDKLRNRDVATQMPLGAEPLAEPEIVLIEDWIRQGAVRRPGAEPAPVLNNPPAPPEIAVFDVAGSRLDLAGPFAVTVGQTLRFRHSVRDFETADSAIPFAAVILQTADGWNVLLGGGDEGTLGITAYDPAGPQGAGDLLNYQFAYTLPAMLPVRDQETGEIGSVAAAGQMLSVFAVYLDSVDDDAMATFSSAPSLLSVE